MPETLEDFLMTRPPTAEKPLLGQTLLVVEDSRFACEAFRLICQRSGARIRRADSLAAAARHLRTYRPGIILIDLGLPDGSGIELVEQLDQSEPRISVIIAMSGDDTREREARLAGADAFIRKPVSSIVEFQTLVLGLMPKDQRPSSVRLVGVDEVVPDNMALMDDLSLALELMTANPDGAALGYVSRFLAGVGRSAKDAELTEAALSVAPSKNADIPGRELANLIGLVRSRLGNHPPV